MSLDSFHVSGTSPTPCRPCRDCRDCRDCRVAILGLGAVGSAVARRLAARDDRHGLTLTHICDRRAALKQALWSERLGLHTIWTTQFDDLLTSDADVIVETVGGVEPAVDWIRAALLAGKSVVTANKQVMAVHGPGLLAIAARQGRQLRFEAAVGGAMPIVRGVGEGLAGDCITRIVAILNGTTNAILSRMDAIGCSFEEALADARACGYAEADPAMDVDGFDARAKLTILCAQAFRLRVDPGDIVTRSSRSITPADIDVARGAGGAIRQLAYAAYDWTWQTLTAWVAPAIVPRESVFARTIGPRNAAVITGAYAGDVEIAGLGAGGDATAVAILGDILSIARDRAAIIPAPVLSVPQAILGITNSEFGILNSEFAGGIPNSTFPIPNFYTEVV